MANGVKQSASLKVHQTLHGYADGHRQLMASFTLKPRDVRTMLVLSDISSSGALIDEMGYLTGYPLPESAMFVLARTWAAPEMPRPGCVWTHSLLIEYSDLATLDDPTSLTDLFRRPSKGDLEGYGIELSGVSKPGKIGLNNALVEFARHLLVELYEKPQSRVIIVRPPILDIESIVLALWAQQWPRLRRTFNFCTLSTTDRSTDSNLFDLQIIPTMDLTARSRFQNVVEFSKGSSVSADWIDHAVSDLQHADIDGLRTFLRQIGGDANIGRKAFRPFCDLHIHFQEFNKNPRSINKAIVLLEKEFGADEVQGVRGMVATCALNQIEQLDETALEFAIRYLDLAEADVVESYGGQLGKEFWIRTPNRFLKLLDGGELDRVIAMKGLALLTVDELVNGFVRVPELTSHALAYHPEIITRVELWSQPNTSIDAALRILATEPKYQSGGIVAIITANRNDLAKKAIQKVGSLEALQIIGSLFDSNTVDRQSIEIWLTASASDTATVASFLASGQSVSWELLTVIAKMFPPDAVPNDIGFDPWLIAVQAAKEPKHDLSSLYLHAYLLSRALGLRSRNSGELAQRTFEQVYLAASTSGLPDQLWEMLDNRLPWSINWAFWDRCQRIRSAVGDLFVNRELSPELFINISNIDHVFMVTAETVAGTRRGRRFLKRVLRLLKSGNMQHYASRMQIIAKLL